MNYKDLHEYDLIPFEAGSLLGQKVLVFAPHPDDETLGCGGSLVKHIKHGDEVVVIFMTDGRQGDFAGSYSHQAYVQMRQEEAKSACAVLGIVKYFFLGIEDRRLGCEVADFHSIVQIINEELPGLIYVPSPLEINPDHRASAELVWQAVAKVQLDIRVCFYEVSTPVRPNLLIDISEEAETKWEAANCYKSQLEEKDYVGIAKSINHFRTLTLSDKSQFAEAFVILHRRASVDGDLSTFFPIMELSRYADTRFPKVSVIIRTRNRKQLLLEALSSVAAQTYHHIEIIVVNDGGTSMMDQLPSFNNSISLRYHDLTDQMGRSAAANKGVELSTGELLIFLDDDDLFYPDHIGSLVAFMEENPSCDLVYSDCELAFYDFSEDGDHVMKSPGKRVFKGVDYDHDQLSRANYIPIITALFRRNLWEKAGPMDESLEVFEDWDLWLRMSMETDFLRHPQVTCHYRIFGSRSYNYLEGQITIYKKHWQNCPPRKIMQWLHESQVENDKLRNRLHLLEQRSW